MAESLGRRLVWRTIGPENRNPKITARSHAGLLTAEDAAKALSVTPGRVRQLLIVTQQAVCLLLLVVSGLFYCSAREAQKVRLGFEPNDVLLLRVNARSVNLNREQQTVMYQRFHESLKNVPALEGYSLEETAANGREGHE